jgi:hypothetical protein
MQTKYVVLTALKGARRFGIKRVDTWKEADGIAYRHARSGSSGWYALIHTPSGQTNRYDAGPYGITTERLRHQDGKTPPWATMPEQDG